MTTFTKEDHGDKALTAFCHKVEPHGYILSKGSSIAYYKCDDIIKLLEDKVETHKDSHAPMRKAWVRDWKYYIAVVKTIKIHKETF